MRKLLDALVDLARGLFGFPATPAMRRDPRAALEERYRGPRRCC